MLFRIFTVLAVVALVASVWILTTSKRSSQSQGGAESARRPGYYLNDAVMTDYNQNGDPSIKIAARRIDQIDHGTEIELHDIRVDYQTAGGDSWVLNGDLAHVEPGGTVVEVTGNVQLKGAALIRTDRMTYDTAAGIASTASDVVIEFADQVLTAHGLLANLRARTVRLESRVNGRFHP